jgi:hypothetical protein
MDLCSPEPQKALLTVDVGERCLSKRISTPQRKKAVVVAVADRLAPGGAIRMIGFDPLDPR